MSAFDEIKAEMRKTNSDIQDDMSFIADMRHIQGSWHQYDFLLAANGYGWDYIVDSADYISKAELEHIGTVSVSDGAGETELVSEFNSAGGSVKSMKSLSDEYGAFGIGGMSKIVGGPVKVVWINQSRVIRIFTPINDEDLMLRYAETIIRRTFETPDSMKKYRPIK